MRPPCWRQLHVESRAADGGNEPSRVLPARAPVFAASFRARRTLANPVRIAAPVRTPFLRRAESRSQRRDQRTAKAMIPPRVGRPVSNGLRAHVQTLRAMRRRMRGSARPEAWRSRWRRRDFASACRHAVEFEGFSHHSPAGVISRNLGNVTLSVGMGWVLRVRLRGCSFGGGVNRAPGVSLQDDPVKL